MNTSTQLRSQLASIHRKSYPAYKSLKGSYDFQRYIFHIEHVQGDPFASPSNVRVFVPHSKAGFPEEYYQTAHTRVALQDYLIRRMEKELSPHSFQAKGSGKSGILRITHCGQEILERTACKIDRQGIHVRFEIGFPANGRTINAPELEKIFFSILPDCVFHALYYKNQNPDTVLQVFELAEDQYFIRQELSRLGLTAFVADGAILPRQSGVSDLPMKNCIPFSSPESLRIQLQLPHKGALTGMGLPRGITLIVGGGYHGKSTLLQALEMGVYNHRKGDGREYVITDSTALKIRAEDGRHIQQVDISLFINDLPNQKDTRAFTSLDASGSTSQAANIAEGLYGGSRLFLIDEDTSATNFMVRDEMMQTLIRREKEPITPFLERIREIYENSGCSTILVAGSSGAFFHKADTLIQMDSYRPIDITKAAKELCQKYPLLPTEKPPYHAPKDKRIVLPHNDRHSRHGSRGPERAKLKVLSKDAFSINRETVDLRYVEQLADVEQTAALAQLLRYTLENLADGRNTVPQICQQLEKLLQKDGLDGLFGTSMGPCNLAMPRMEEIRSCLNRYRGWKN